MDRFEKHCSRGYALATQTHITSLLSGEPIYWLDVSVVLALF